MIDLKKIAPQLEVVIEPILSAYHLQIYEINLVKDFENNDVLQVLIEFEARENKGIDFDLLTKVNEEISVALDQLGDLFPTPYVLEVASAGIEKPIRNVNELNQALNEYVYVEFNHPIKGINSTYATVSGYDPHTQQYEFSFFVKGQKQRLQATFAELSFIRHAVKF